MFTIRSITIIIRGPADIYFCALIDKKQKENKNSGACYKYLEQLFSLSLLERKRYVEGREEARRRREKKDAEEEESGGAKEKKKTARKNEQVQKIVVDKTFKDEK